MLCGIWIDPCRVKAPVVARNNQKHLSRYFLFSIIGGGLQAIMENHLFTFFTLVFNQISIKAKLNKFFFPEFVFSNEVNLLQMVFLLYVCQLSLKGDIIFSVHKIAVIFFLLPKGTSFHDYLSNFHFVSSWVPSPCNIQTKVVPSKDWLTAMWLGSMNHAGLV